MPRLWVIEIRVPVQHKPNQVTVKRLFWIQEKGGGEERKAEDEIGEINPISFQIFIYLLTQAIRS